MAEESRANEVSVLPALRTKMTLLTTARPHFFPAMPGLADPCPTNQYMIVKETLGKLIPLMVRQAHHEWNQPLTVRPEPVEGLIQNFLNASRG